MAPKRAVKKAAAPPPPPEESSDETRSGSRSRSDDSEEDEEAIADSPVPAATPALKNAPAPSQKGGESESSEDEDEEEEEEEEPVRAAPKNQPPPPPPQKKEDSDASGSDDDDDDEEAEEEDEEEEDEPTRAAAAPPSAPKKQPPQPEKKENSDTSGDDGESEDEEAPPPKPAPKKEAEALKLPAPAEAETKKPGAVQRIWSTDDEVRILEAVAAHQKQHGTFPQPEALVDVLAGKLDNPAYGSKELHSKVRSLRTRYLTLSKRGELPSKEHDRRVLNLCKMVWDSDKTTPAAAAAANGHERKGFEEMCELYPYLAEEVKEMEAARPGFCKREFGKMDDDKARAMDEKIKRQRVAHIRLEMRRADLAKEVTKALIDLVDA